MSDLPHVAVIGTGSWGTTLAVMMTLKGLPVTLWARTPEEAQRLQDARENRDFVPGLSFPPALVVTSALDQALERAALVLMVVPAQTMRDNTRRVRDLLPREAVVVSAAKGLEVGTRRRMSEVLAEELPPALDSKIAVLSGPNLFREIANGLPTASVVAAHHLETARFAQDLMMLPRFRLYTHEDVVGVELGGALKNIIAVAAGAVEEFGLGDNAKAMVLTRGLAEISRLAVAAGASPLTLAGLAGMGDLIATCASPHSRNHQVGRRLARGEKIEAIRASTKMVAEGVPTTRAAMQMALSLGVEMPIAEQVHAVLFENKDPRQAVTDLLARGAKHELD